MPLNDSERLEQLEQAFERLIDESATAAIVVEGPRDREALARLGVDRNVTLVNSGKTLISVADDLAADHDRVILLMDWDRTGGRLTRRLLETLERHGVTCDTQHRKALSGLTGRELSTVEELPGFLRRLRQKVGVPVGRLDRHGPDRYGG